LNVDTGVETLAGYFISYIQRGIVRLTLP
jgi:hypothetical protein